MIIDFYTYVLMDPRFVGPYKYGHLTFSHRPFYVGKGQKYRAFQFLSGKPSHNPAKTAVGHRHGIVLLNDPEETRDVAHYRCSGGHEFSQDARVLYYCKTGKRGCPTCKVAERRQPYLVPENTQRRIISLHKRGATSFEIVARLGIHRARVFSVTRPINRETVR